MVASLGLKIPWKSVALLFQLAYCRTIQDFLTTNALWGRGERNESSNARDDLMAQIAEVSAQINELEKGLN